MEAAGRGHREIDEQRKSLRLVNDVLGFGPVPTQGRAAQGTELEGIAWSGRGASRLEDLRDASGYKARRRSTILKKAAKFLAVGVRRRSGNRKGIGGRYDESMTSGGSRLNPTNYLGGPMSHPSQQRPPLSLAPSAWRRWPRSP